MMFYCISSQLSIVVLRKKLIKTLSVLNLDYFDFSKFIDIIIMYLDCIST